MSSEDRVDQRVPFEQLIADTEPRLRRAFAARFGVQLGNDVTADALAWAWEHREFLETTTNPAGYLYRVGQSSVRRYRRWARPPAFPAESLDGHPDAPLEPGLDQALRKLTNDQRVAVVLVHGYGMPYAEAAELLGVPVTTLRNHLHRGLERLRTTLKVHDVD